MSDDHVDRARWDTVYGASPTPHWDRITRATLGACLPADVNPMTVWPSWPLEEVAAELRVADGATLVDLGCGRAELGAWVAGYTGARYVGVDPSPVAVEQARRMLSDRVDGTAHRIVEGHFSATGLPDGAADAVLSTDVFHFIVERGPALAETARILRPGGRLVMTMAERPGTGDIAEDCDRAGLRVLRRDETPDWRERMLAARAAVAAQRDELEKELGADQVDRILHQNPAHDDNVRHLLFVAERQAI